MVCHHRISSPCECRRMMCLKSLEVTRTSLTTCCISLCNSSCRNTYRLSKSLLVKYWWCLTSTPWTPSTSSSSTSHCPSTQFKWQFNFNTVSLRHKHSPETLIMLIIQFIYYVPAFLSNASQLIQLIKSFFFNKKFIFKNFIFPKFCLILLDFI